jgi:hypothetical protein
MEAMKSPGCYQNGVFVPPAVHQTLSFDTTFLAHFTHEVVIVNGEADTLMSGVSLRDHLESLLSYDE